MYSLVEINKAFLKNKTIKDKAIKFRIFEKKILDKAEKKHKKKLNRLAFFVCTSVILATIISLNFNANEIVDTEIFLILFILSSAIFFIIAHIPMEKEKSSVYSRLKVIKETYDYRVSNYNKKIKNLNRNNEKYFNQLKVLERRGQLHLIQDELIDIVIENKQKQLNVVVDSHSDKINHLIKLEENIKIGAEIHNE